MRLKERVFYYNNQNFDLKDQLSKNIDKKIQKWKKSKPFETDPSLFFKRLQSDGVNDIDHLTALIAMPFSNQSLLASPTREIWWDKLSSIYQKHKTIKLPTEVIELLREQTPNYGFINLVAPILNWFIDQIDTTLMPLQQKKASLTFSDSIKNSIILDLSSTLIARIARTMTLEINVFKLEGKLIGETSQERFTAFSLLLLEEEVFENFLSEYPLLFRQILIDTENKLRFINEFINHLIQDWEKIWGILLESQETFPLSQIKFAGDSHRNGRSVLILDFSSKHKLVYKPRDLSTDVHFYQLLEWLNDKGVQPGFRTLKILNCKSHGWVEFIEQKECSSLSEVERFFQRQGGNLAILHSLSATDFHFENVIASGEHPILIDLESLFHIPEMQLESGNASQEASLILQNSVFAVGMLPSRIWASKQGDSVDVSALGGIAGQMSSLPLPVLENTGTDEIKLVRKKLGLRSESNLPVFDGNAMDVTNFRKDFHTGFVNTYNIILDNRKELINDNGIIMSFANDEVRRIVRDTHSYYRLLLESFHPDVLRDAIDRDILLDNLWLGHSSRKMADQVIQAEQEDIWQGDIPYFSTTPSSKNLICSNGNSIVDFFETSGLERVKEKINSLSQEDLELQIFLINYSLSTSKPLSKAYPINQRNTYRNELSTQWNDHLNKGKSLNTPLKRAEFLSEATKIGEQLIKRAIIKNNDACWIGDTILGEHIGIGPTNFSLYSGNAGVALFFAHLTNITGETKYKDIATKSLNLIINQFEGDLKDQSQNIIGSGAFEGMGGLIYTFAHISKLWNNRGLLDFSARLVKSLSDQVSTGYSSPDIISGSAGLIGCLIPYYELTGDPVALKLAIKNGEGLVQLAEVQEHGVAWKIEHLSDTFHIDKPMAGFSHGVAGIAWSLMKLSELSNRVDFHNLALRAIDYERSLFIEKNGNWLDLRFTDEREAAFMTAWCHGAPGIGMARLDTLKLGDYHFEKEIQTAIKTAQSDLFLNYNHSLCHGDLGNLDFLLYASQILNDKKMQNIVNDAAHYIITDIHKHGWRTGIPFEAESPGFMTGISGIGYELLRIGFPDIVPSVLLLKMPG